MLQFILIKESNSIFLNARVDFVGTVHGTSCAVLVVWWVLYLDVQLLGDTYTYSNVITMQKIYT